METLGEGSMGPQMYLFVLQHIRSSLIKLIVGYPALVPIASQNLFWIVSSKGLSLVPVWRILFLAVLRIRDPYICGPPGSASWSVSHKYGSGSGSFHHQTKIVLKNLDFYFVTSLWPFIFEEWCKLPVFGIRMFFVLPDPLARSTEPRRRIRVRTKIWEIRNAGS
jgi:hypothetical protein